MVKTKEKSKSNEVAPRNKVALELLHHTLGHRYIRSLMVGDTEKFWQDIKIRKDPDPFCTLCQISSMNERQTTDRGPTFWERQRRRVH